jgi:hypothetical protein
MNSVQASQITLAEFLRARLDEDEAAAKAAEHADGPDTLSWRRGGARHLTFDNHCSEDYESVFAGNWDRILIARDSVHGGPLAAHIARHDPARTLREVEAKRARLARYERAHEQVIVCREAGDPAESLSWARAASELWLSIADDAAVYGGHPDYRAEWAA